VFPVPDALLPELVSLQPQHIAASNADTSTTATILDASALKPALKSVEYRCIEVYVLP
jgi:hypothetical protein